MPGSPEHSEPPIGAAEHEPTACVVITTEALPDPLDSRGFSDPGVRINAGLFVAFGLVSVATKPRGPESLWERASLLAVVLVGVAVVGLVMYGVFLSRGIWKRDMTARWLSSRPEGTPDADALRLTFAARTARPYAVTAVASLLERHGPTVVSHGVRLPEEFRRTERDNDDVGEPAEIEGSAEEAINQFWAPIGALAGYGGAMLLTQSAFVGLLTALAAGGAVYLWQRLGAIRISSAIATPGALRVAGWGRERVLTRHDSVVVIEPVPRRVRVSVARTDGVAWQFLVRDADSPALVALLRRWMSPLPTDGASPDAAAPPAHAAASR